MASLGVLVPARFLALTAHLVTVLTILWARDPHVLASLPLEFSPEEYARVDTELLVALGVTLGLLALELGGFLSGLSMFHRPQALLSAMAHGGTTLALLLFLAERWDCGAYWGLLGAGSALPAATELLLMGVVLGCKRKVG
ncbi:transmembrane protein 107 isoform X2 [Dromaius novaehollandiae]|uniref:transmembrane protein 107 isoform X2 n=1 Tax=Dromaius novaehollandiae TaxID=8790 RepID=UPI00311FCB2E